MAFRDPLIVTAAELLERHHQPAFHILWIPYEGTNATPMRARLHFAFETVEHGLQQRLGPLRETDV